MKHSISVTAKLLDLGGEVEVTSRVWTREDGQGPITICENCRISAGQVKSVQTQSNEVRLVNAVS